MDEEESTFSSPQEEAAYWKSKAHEYRESLDENREELEEFQISSRELEAELETQLEQLEARNRDLTSSNQRYQMEVESLREKLEQNHTITSKQIMEQENDLSQVRGFKDELQKYIRELEQSNDDLDRSKRSAIVSLEDFEQRLNMAIERNAFLESELDEKENLAITVQRLKDEARDLGQELQIQRKRDVPEEKHDNSKKKKDEEDMVVETDAVDSNKITDIHIITPPTTPTRSLAYNNNVTGQPGIAGTPVSGGTPFTPSARISALNIVGDLLRKVGALESKLASCRNFVNTQQPRTCSKPSTSSASNSPRAKRVHRSGPGIPSPGSAAPTSQSGYVNVKVTI